MNATGFDEGLDGEAERKARQQVPKLAVNLKQEGLREGKSSLPAKLRRCHVFYSLDGDEVMAYNIEVHSENTGTDTGIKTEERSGVDSRGARIPGSPGSPNSENGLPARFIYSESLREDILEHFHLVAYQEFKSDSMTTESVNILKSQQADGFGSVMDSASCGDPVQKSGHTSPGEPKSSSPRSSYVAFLRMENGANPKSTSLKDPILPALAHSLLCDTGTGAWCSHGSQSSLPDRNPLRTAVAAAVFGGPEALHSQSSCQKDTGGEENGDSSQNQHNRRFSEVMSSIMAQRRQTLTSILSAKSACGAKFIDRFSQDVNAAKRLWRCEADNDDDEYEILSDDEGTLTCGTPTTEITAMDSSREPMNSSYCLTSSLGKLAS